MPTETAYDSFQANGNENRVENFINVLQKRVMEDSEKNYFTSKPHIQINQPLTEETWFEEEATKRDFPLTNKLQKRLQCLLRENQENVVVFYDTEITRLISENISRLSREEPGGMEACRVHVNLVQSDFANSKNGNKTTEKSMALSLGSVNLSDNVPTSEIHVYLFPSSSVLSKLQSVLTSLSTKNTTGKWSLRRRVTLLPQFVLVKTKLFRCNRRNSITIIKSSASN